jgi:tetratricopeptide (TPR) repeat protein
MEVVFYPAVKNRRMLQIMRKSVFVCTIVIWCGSLLFLSDPAYTASVHIGGSDSSARIVFDLKAPASPEILQEERTLIVNFPDTFADPQTLTDQSMVEKLTFDGKTASITIIQPFTYRVYSEKKSPRFIIDLIALRGAHDTCPIKHIDANLDKGMTRITLYLDREKQPKVRTTKDGRIYLHFSKDISCEQIPKLISSIPQLQYVGTLKMQMGSLLCFAVADKNMLLDVKAKEQDGEVVLKVGSSNGSATPESRFSLARSYSDSGNIAGVISSLEPSSKSLNVQEKILLSRAYWASAYPYKMGSRSTKSLALMNEALHSIKPGMERERLMLEYCSMLIKSGHASVAADPIHTLKDSAWDDIAAEASIREIDILNHRRAFQDAYVASRRLIRDFGQDSIPVRLKSLYLSVQADTYLGLNDNPKALSFYKDALAADPSLIRHNPGISSRMADATYNMNDFEGAKEYILQAVNTGDPSDRQKYLLMLGDCMYKLGEKNKALIIFSQVENNAPRNDTVVIAKLKTAKIMLEKGTDDHGRVSDKVFNQVMDIYESLKSTEESTDPSLASLVKIRIAQAYARHGDWDKALDTYHKAWSETKPADPIHRYAQTEATKSIMQHLRTLYRDSRHQEVYELYMRYRNSFIKGFTDPEALFIIGFSLSRTGHTDLAKTPLISSTKGESPYRNQALTLLFMNDLKMGNYQDALTWDTMYLSSYPDGEGAQLMRDKQGEVLYLLGRLNDAVPYLEASTGRGDPSTLTLLSYLSDTYRRLSMRDKEEEILEKIISFHPKITSPVIEEALYLRANQLKHESELERARFLYQELLNTYPRSLHAYWAMYHQAQIVSALGDFTEAKGLLTNVIRLSNDQILISAARVASNEMDLKRDLNGYGFLKEQSKGE